MWKGNSIYTEYSASISWWSARYSWLLLGWSKHNPWIISSAHLEFCWWNICTRLCSLQMPMCWWYSRNSFICWKQLFLAVKDQLRMFLAILQDRYSGMEWGVFHRMTVAPLIHLRGSQYHSLHQLLMTLKCESAWEELLLEDSILRTHQVLH